MTMHFRTLMLLGFTGLAGLVSGCIIETSSGPGPSGSNCVGQQYFNVSWEVDRGSVASMLTCALTPPSHVEVTTSASEVLLLVAPAFCDDRNFYNWNSTTGSGIAVGTTLVAADLINDADNTVLSSADVPTSKQFPISACAPASLSIQFPIQ